MDATAKLAEERKRDRMYDPALRWKHMMEFLAFAEANLKPEFRRNRPRWRDERGKVHYY
jgi:hypothetical protein